MVLLYHSQYLISNICRHFLQNDHMLYLLDFIKILFKNSRWCFLFSNLNPYFTQKLLCGIFWNNFRFTISPLYFWFTRIIMYMYMYFLLLFLLY